MRTNRYSHVVWSVGLKAAKPFLPSGKTWNIRNFQQTFKSLVGKIRVSERLLSQYGLMPRVKLGRVSLSEVEHIAEYLYKNSIHPILFASALHLIASQAKSLEPRVQIIQLRNLRRENIQTYLQRGVIADSDIGAFIYQEVEISIEDKLTILEKLRVITYYPKPVDPKLAGLPLFNLRRR